MGICSSCESDTMGTAKLILQDGQLVEFPYSVKVSYLLQNYQSCFICDSDSMEFKDFVSAMHADEELLPGRLYFLFPLSRLRYPLQSEEMAALAVKASLALRGSAYNSRQERSIRRLSSDGCYPVGGGKTDKKNSRSSCKGSGSNFISSKSRLGVILEFE